MAEDSDGKCRLKPRKLWIDSIPFSPDHYSAVTEVSPPKLRLTHFSTKAVVDFGNVKVGKLATRKLVVENPNFYEVEVSVEKFPWKKNFRITEEIFNVDEKGFYNLEVMWMPKESGNCRELIMMKYDNGFRVHALILGHAESPAKKVKRRKRLANPVKKSLTYNSNATGSSTLTSYNTDNTENLDPSAFTTAIDSNVRLVKSPLFIRDSSLPATPPSLTKSLDFVSLRNALLPLHVVNSDNQRDSCGSITAPTSPSGLDAPIVKSGNSSPALKTANQVILSPAIMRTPKELQRETFCIDPKISKLPEQHAAFPVPDLTGRPTYILPMMKQPVAVVQPKLSFLTPTKKDSDAAFKLTPRSHRRSRTFTKKVAEQLKDDKENAESPGCNPPVLEKPVVASDFGTKKDSPLYDDCSSPDDSLEQDAKPLKMAPNLPATPSISVTDTALSTAALSVHAIVSPPARNEVAEAEHLSSTQAHERTGGGLVGPLPVPDISVIDAVSPMRMTEKKSVDVFQDKTKAKRTAIAQVKTARASPKRRPTKTVYTTPNIKGKTPLGRKPVKTRDALTVPKLHGGSSKKKLRNSALAKARRSPSASRRANLSIAKKLHHAPERPKSAKKRKPKMPITRLVLKKSPSNRRSSPVLVRNPFASRNMCYDERWRQKQEYAYAAWLNYILTPDEFKPSLESKDATAGKGKNRTSSHFQVFSQKLDKCHPTLPALTKESASIRAYRIRKRLKCLRHSGMKLFQSDEFQQVVGKVEEAVESGHIKLRNDKQLWADIGQKGKVLEWLLSFHALWLRLGLEVTFGDELMSSMDASALSGFITKKLLSCVDIEQEFAHPTVPHCFKPGYTEKISKYTLKKFLILIYFLDQAKVNRLIDHDPCLFRKDSQYRNCKDILQLFSSELLRGEGDIVKHLGFLGYRVKYQQTYIDEFEFGISNIAVDLRDGIRLVRIVELLFHQHDLTPKLRVPAGSLLQKRHNVNIALKALEGCGVGMSDGKGSEIEANHVVKGHCEMTLALLWNIASYFQLYKGVDEKSLQDEIEYLKKNLRLKHMMERTENFYDNDEDAPVNASQTTGVSALLLEWCRLVCAFHSIPVHNFGSSFTDGRVLAHLVSHYQSNLLQPTKINMLTTLSQHDQDFNLDDSSITEATTAEEISRAQLLRNEKANLKMVQNAAYEMGGIPDLLRIDDICNTIPDNKVVRLFLSFLCVRLLDISAEERAARTIQVAWRAYNYRKNILANLRAMEEEGKRRVRAAVTIQAAYRSYRRRVEFKRMKTAVAVIQRAWRSKCEATLFRKDFLKLKSAAILVQTLFRAKTARKLVARLRREHANEISAARVLQYFWRNLLVRRQYLLQKEAAVKIQRFFRNWRIGKRQRAEYFAYKSAVIKVQLRWRETLEMRKQVAIFSTKREAVVLIQGAFREYRMKKRTVAAVLIQRRWRACCLMKNTRNLYILKRSATIVIQTAIRAFQAKKVLTKMREGLRAAIVIQGRWRAHLWMKEDRRKFLLLRDSTICIQACVRSYQARKVLDKLRREIEAAVAVQRKWRATLLMRSEKRRFLKMKEASVIIQCAWRCVLARKKFVDMERRRDAILVIQRRWRAHIWMNKDKQRFLLLRNSTIAIQAYVRSYQARKVLEKLQREFRAAVVVQRKWRATLQMRSEKMRFLKMKEASIIIQCAWRCDLARKRFVNMKRRTAAILVIQRRWRAHLWMKENRKRFMLLRDSTIVIQACVRSYHARKVLDKLRRELRAAVVVQRKWRATLLMRGEKRRFLKMKDASTIIQCAWRCVLARKKFGDVKRLRNAILVIQRRWRAHVLMKEERCRFLHLKYSAIVIQTHFRSFQARMMLESLRRELRATLLIQRRWRVTLLMRNENKRFSKMKRASVIIQCAWRCWLARKEYADMKKRKFSILIIQRRWRAHVLMKEQRCRFLKLRDSVIVIQTHIRSYRARMALVSLQKRFRAATLIQNRWRATLMMRIETERFSKMKTACLIIQCAWRCSLARKEFEKFKRRRDAALVIQCRWKAMLAAREARKVFLQKRNAVIQIQGALRCTFARRELVKLKQQYKAAQVIQRFWAATLKMRDERKMYLRKREAAVTIQCFVKSALAKRELLKLRSRWEAARIIQACWRGFALMKVTKESFMLKKKSVIVLQSQYRGCLARRILKKKRAELSAAKTIQARWRATLDMRHQKMRFLLMKDSAILVQSYWRCFLARRTLAELRSRKRAAVIIQRKWQATFMMRRERNEFERKKNSSIVIQCAFRQRRARKLRDELKRKWDATVIIQKMLRATLRMREARSDYLRKRNAAITVQCFFRVILAKSFAHRLCAELAATKMLQKHWRARVEMRTQRHRYLKMKKSAVTIQCALRRMLACKELAALRRRLDAAAVIQYQWKATIKMRVARKAYLQEKRACTLIQCAWRCTLARRCLSELRTRYRCATFIQMKWRAHLDMKTQRAQYVEIIKAATKIQSVFRSISAQNKLSKLRQRRDAALFIQAKWRATLLMRDTRSDFLRKKKAVVVLQCACRRFAAKKLAMNLQMRLDAAIAIQRRWRATLLARKVRETFLCQRHAALTVQCAFRCFSAKEKLMELKRRQDAAIAVQRKWRATILGKQIFGEFLQKRSSSIIIQSAFRCFLAKKVLLSLRRRFQAAITIQERWRATMSMKNDRAAFLQKRNAAVVIQRSTKVYLSKKQLNLLRERLSAALTIQKKWRATLLMRQDSRIYVEKMAAILKIQSIFRCLLAKRALELKKLERDAVVVVQRRWRATLAMRKDRESFLRKKRAAVIIQSAFWCHLAKILLATLKREMNAAKVIQRYWKATALMKFQRTEFFVKKKAIVTIQSCFRRFLARKSFLQLQKEHTSARKIQAKWRATMLMREAKLEFDLKKCAAVNVQCAYRSYLAKKRVQKMRERVRATIIIQTRWRATILMNEQLRVYLQIRRHIVTVQKIVRGFIAKRLLTRLKAKACAARIIQQKWCGFREMRTERNRFLRMKFAASLIQRAFKCHLARTKSEEKRMQHEAAAKIQAKWKAILLMRKERQKFLELKQAAIKVQSCIRRFLARKLRRKMTEEREAAKVIQIRWRAMLQMREERKRFLQKKDAIAIIRQAFLCRLAKGMLSRVKAKRNAAIAIQRKWRAYIAMRQQRKDYLTARRSAIIIQCALRKMLAVRELRYRKSRLQAVLVVQKYWRAWALTRQTRKRYLRILKSASVIQSFYRGYLIRRAITDWDMIRAKRRCTMANQHARKNPQRKICNRMNSALSVLLDAKAYDTVYATLQDLYSLSWLLPYCCERISEDGGTEVLCQLITCSNRSYHAAFVQKFAINILLNLIKNESTRYDTCQILATNDSKSGCAPMEMLVTVLSRFRDKGNRDQSHVLVFCAACTLLIEFCRDESNTKLLKSKTKSVNMIKYINRETASKMKIKAKYEEVQRGKKERESVGYMTLSSTLSQGNVLNQSNFLDVTSRETSFLRDMDSLRVSTPKSKGAKPGAENRNPSGGKQRQKPKEPSAKKIVSNLFGDNPAVPKIRESLVPQKPGFHTNIPIHRPKKVTKPLSPNFKGSKAKPIAPCHGASGRAARPVRVPRIVSKNLVEVAYDELDHVSCIRCLTGLLDRAPPGCSET